MSSQGPLSVIPLNWQLQPWLQLQHSMWWTFIRNGTRFWVAAWGEAVACVMDTS
jgi:hypothetical protein